MGLILNSSKCELLAHPGVTVNNKRLQSYQTVVPSDAILLGAPLFRGPVLDQAWADRCDDLSIAIKRLSQLGSHDALLLLLLLLRLKFCNCFDALLRLLTPVPSLLALGPWAPPAERGPSLESIYRVSLTVDLRGG